MFWRKALIFWKSIVIVCAIAYVSLLREPSVALPPISGIDKYMHMLMYLVLTWTLLWDSETLEWYRSGNGNSGRKVWKWWFIVLIFPILYGGCIELLQETYFSPRTGEWLDWGADCIGVILAIVTWLVGQWWYARRMDK
jgi:VanZ family protein